MFRPCLLIFFLFFQQIANSQQPIFQWAKQFGSSVLEDTYNDNGRSIVVDQQGNVYSVGLFFNVVDFDPGPGIYNLTGGGIYISKLNSSGEFVWAKQLLTSPSGPIYISIDRNSNVYITSYFGGTIDFDPGPAVFNVASIGPQDAFVLKLTANGDFVWVRQFGGAGPNNGAASYALDIDQNDNVIVCGSFYGTIDFDPGPTTTNLTGIGTSEVFVVKLSSNGDFVWAKKLGNFISVSHYVDLEDVKCDNLGNIYATGWFQGVCDFDPGTGSFNLVSGGPADGFVVKLDGNGIFTWAKKIGHSAGNNVVQPRGIDVDSDNNVYTTGAFLGTQDFDPGNNSYTLTSNGSFDAYILKMNSLGDFIWAKNFGSSNGDNSYDITVDNSNHVYTIGSFSGLCDFDPGPSTFSLSLYDDAVLSKFDPYGNFEYAAAFTRIVDGMSTGRRLVTDFAKNIYITGSFGGTVDFDPGSGNYILDEGRGWIDAFVLKLAKCTNITTANLTISSCNSYTLNNHTYDTSGIYLQTIPNYSGCDSIITLNITINKKFTDQIKVICQGEFFYAGGANQTTAGIYKDTLQTSLGCDSVITTHLTVYPKPLPNLGPDKNLCKNTQLTITPGVFTSYLWQNMSTQSTFTIDTPGLYWATVTNSDNCPATDSIRINTILQPPENFLKAVDSICAYEKLLLQPLSNFSSYLWSTGSTQKSFTIETPGQYWLRVSDANGCYGNDTTTIALKDCITNVFIPTAFTPNNDGKNDFFGATVPANIQSFKLQVFDRAGLLIFQTTNPAKKWDGVYKGVAYSTAMFVWQCFYQLKNEAPGYQKGTIILIK